MAKKLIETMEFKNPVHAQEVIDSSEASIVKIKKAFIPASISTGAFIISTLGVVPNDSVYGILLLISFIGAIVSYIMGGGLKIALKAACKLAIAGWFICPFPIDIAVGICTMIFAPMAFFFLPLVFIFLNYRQKKRSIEEAEDYIESCQQYGFGAVNYGYAPAYAPASAYAYAEAPAYAPQQPAYVQPPVCAQAPINTEPATPVNVTNPPRNKKPCPPPFVK